MPIREAYGQGELCWVDLSSHNATEAAQFYSEMFGWQAVPGFAGEGPPYFQFQLSGQIVAGLTELPAEMQAQGIPPMWNSYLAVDDIQAALKKAESLGAQIAMPAFPVEEVGQLAAILDPTGAMLFLWQKHQFAGATLVNDPGCWCWNELLTHDPTTAQQFYGSFCDWQFEASPPSPESQTPYWTAIRQGRETCGLLHLPASMNSIPAHWGVYFTVENTDAAAERVKQLGGVVHLAPFDVSVGRIATVADPQGAVFNLFQFPAQ